MEDGKKGCPHRSTRHPKHGSKSTRTGTHWQYITMTQYDMSMNKYIYTSRNLCFIGCFSWMIMMIPCFTLNNGWFNKHPVKKMVVWSTRYIFTKEHNLKLYIYPNLLSKTQPVQKCLGIFWAVQKVFGFQGEACTHQRALVAIPIYI